MPRSELSQRVISGLLLAAAALAYLFYVELVPFVLVACLLGLIATFEFGRAGIAKGLPMHQAGLYLNHLLFFSGLWFQFAEEPEQAKLFLLTLGASILINPILAKGRFLPGLLWQLVGLAWITLPFFVITLLRFESDQGALMILFVILTAAINDISAYFGGKKFGKRKLAAAISPNKTIEGSLFGYLGGLIAGLGFAHLYLPDFAWTQLIWIIPLLVFAAQAGDLIESKYKRYCGIKDSGNILPGHGGILDRFDAYLTSLPLFWLLLRFL